MAGEFVGIVFAGLHGFDPSTKLVAVALADRSNVKGGGVSWPSLATLGRMTGLSETQVRHHLRLLEAGGWLSREGAVRGGKGKTPRYRLNLKRMQSVAAAACNSASESKPLGRPQGSNDANPSAERVQTPRPAADNPSAGRTRTGIGSLTGSGTGAAPTPIQPLTLSPSKGERLIEKESKAEPELVTRSITPFLAVVRNPPPVKSTMTKDEQLAYVARKLAEQTNAAD